MSACCGGLLEYEYDLTHWKYDGQGWRGGSMELWEDYRFIDKNDPKHVALHPKHMSDYAGLQSVWIRDLFARAVCVDGDDYLEIIKLQEDLKFHLYYTGMDPEDGTDE